MYVDIEREVRELDIAILVNNAGVICDGYFRDISADAIRDCSLVNTFPYMLLTKMLLPLL